MNRTSFLALGFLIPALALQACGSDSDGDKSLDGASGKPSAGAGGTMTHISPGGAGAGGSAAKAGSGSAAAAGKGGSGGNASGKGGNGGTASGTGGGSTGGTGSGARGGTNSGATGGGNDAAGASGDSSGPPGPTDDGSSPYTVECDESTPCSDPTSVTCLGILLEEGGARFTCSNDCQTSADCSDAPTGTDAKAECVQFTSAKHCVIVCYDAGAEADCPDGMGCYRYTDSPIGYCLWP